MICIKEALKHFIRSNQIFRNFIINYFDKTSTIYNYVTTYDMLLKVLGGGGVVVRNGPFKGLKYASLEAAGSSLFPKLLGSYERELYEIIETTKKNIYSEVIDIGCAEGYYAIGFALGNNVGKVYAYDIDLNARKLCCNMAKANNVKHKVIISDKCTDKTLANFNFTGRSLVISDCEGYERILFNKLSVKNLLNSDVLIEVHDYDLSKNYKVTNYKYLINLFKSTHNYKVINSIDDYQKIYTYKYKELQGFDNSQKFLALRERRACIMKWLFFTPKNFNVKEDLLKCI